MSRAEPRTLKRYQNLMRELNTDLPQDDRHRRAGLWKRQALEVLAELAVAAGSTQRSWIDVDKIALSEMAMVFSLGDPGVGSTEPQAALDRLAALRDAAPWESRERHDLRRRFEIELLTRYVAELHPQAVAGDNSAASQAMVFHFQLADLEKNDQCGSHLAGCPQCPKPASCLHCRPEQ